MSSNNQPDDFQVIQSLQRILESSDLTKLTRKEVRKSLEKELGGNFSSTYWKQKIKTQIEEFVRKKESGVNNHSNTMPTKQASSSSDNYGNEGSKKRGRYDDEGQRGRNDDDYNPNPNPKRRKIDHSRNNNNNNNGYGHNDNGHRHNNNNNNNNNGSFGGQNEDQDYNQIGH
eukprot:CAMPEP_0201592710 /NCGR_PEP_ID=MMETSP0190_2-20130828/190537_1 /ASSEMBLY_ACC=CAM_ASM_000263 /TAXON_ID=37353 /ORGANISM="Rosalina sp." /LENGTH=171 /DNA_ID=CAMNT_0048051613 /DNA_START=91 /DNA_END=607 /DNA_ORIENTATION=-